MASIVERGGKFLVRVTRRGHPQINRTFTLRKDAEAFARTTEADLERGLIKADRGDKVTLRDLVRRYLDEVVPGKRGHEVEAVRIKAMLRPSSAARSILDRLMSDLQPHHVAAWRDARLKVVAAATVRREWEILSHVTTTARLDWGYSNLDSPFARLRKPRVSNARDRRVIDAEVEAICDATESVELASLVRLALATAARRSELLSLTWRDTDLNRKVAVLRAGNTKNGHARQLPLSPAALEVLRSLPRDINGGRIFTMQPHSVTQAFNRAADRARKTYVVGGGADPHFLADLRFHDLRHEGCSRLAELGLSAFELSAVSGHRTLQLAARYTHLQADKMADRLAAAVA